ncbi:hypothetical protein [Rosistilla oblonga]|uniref:hypothetical protein n=1 Tax=Rosistilla oblonga TaxID=2527990 RepID=UPI0011A2C06D|nr:hypothetical protein [Rosistilla oblonga]
MIPAEETAKRVAEYASNRRERLQKELATPYRPRKPLKFKVLAERDSLNKGDILEIAELPSIEEMFTAFGPQRVLFRCMRSGKEIEHHCENGLVQKFIRLRIENVPLTAKVTVKRRSQEETIDFSIEIPPANANGPKT